MKVICEQYLEIVLKTAKKDLERATEFLVIAATLLAIKSKSLLPRTEEEEEGTDIGYDDRFFEDLRERLIAYELTKNRAETLRSMPQHGVDTFSRNDRRALIPTVEMITEEEEDIQSLTHAFVGLLKRIGVGTQFLKIQFRIYFCCSLYDAFCRFDEICKENLFSFYRAKVFQKNLLIPKVLLSEVLFLF